MKKQLLGLMAILSVLDACQKNEVTSLSKDETIRATIENNDATRTIMDKNNNILWSENDQIIAFMKSSYGHKYQVKPSFVGKSYADFSVVSSSNGSDLSAGNEWEHNVVYYPYSEDIECLKSGANYELEVNLPAEQVYVPDSFANGSMTMIAVSENNNITFKNVLGGIKLQLKGTQKVTSIKIEGKNNEKLSGAAIVTAYTDETKPAVTMSSNATTSVTLNCGEGVQLNESKATEFIISLPPVLFSNGFTVTITDTDAQIYIIGTDKANTILRSSILVMPTINLKTLEENEPELDDDILVIPTESIALSVKQTKMYPTQSQPIEVKFTPSDATNRNVTWSSSNPLVATVDQNGTILAISSGTAVITAASGGVKAECQFSVIRIASATNDYIDEYGINWGKGIVLGEQVWAPVNCGYKEPIISEMGEVEDLGYPYGKLYQWGRKYGQGLGEGYDSANIIVEEGGVSLKGGQHSSNANKFYQSIFTSQYNDWLSTSDNYLWNSGTLSDPVKTAYDPCPSGWRVPTVNELKELSSYGNYSELVTLENGIKGRYSSGIYEYSQDATSIFLLVSGYRGEGGSVYEVNKSASYWSSTVAINNAPILEVDDWDMNIYGEYSSQSLYTRRALGYSVRCVQE